MTVQKQSAETMQNDFLEKNNNEAAISIRDINIFHKAKNTFCVIEI